MPNSVASKVNAEAPGNKRPLTHRTSFAQSRLRQFTIQRFCHHCREERLRLCFHGGWCWRRVAQVLQLDHHKAFAVTLTGLGERAHLLSPAINLDTHINDVINLIEAEELHEVTLAVHSYAGMIGTAVADRMRATPAGDRRTR